MECPKCHLDNPDSQKFCGECGTSLTAVGDAQPTFTQTMETPSEKLTRGLLFAGRYEIIEELGRGGMGRVYRVEDTKVNEEIALKLIKPEISVDRNTIERFRNELKIARRIAHRHVCRMFDLGEDGGTHYITMEYVPGEDLKNLLRRVGRLDTDTIVKIGRQICGGLSEAHRLGVVHRDLKPANIMIDKEGNARIMDFGIARSLRTEGVTGSGIMIGTPQYMSPEQAEAGEIDHRSDIYSLGILLYEMVTGAVPFVGDSALSIAMKHKTEAPADPRELNPKAPGELCGLILKCLEKDREQRFQGSEELVSEFRNIQEGLPTTTGIHLPQPPAFMREGEGDVEPEGPVFVAREEELCRLQDLAEKALAGSGRVVFVKGEAGCGKTALIQEFARRAQEQHPDLIVAGGKCNAHTGIGDPYLPFIELLGLLTGDVAAKWDAGIITREHAVRLWQLTPHATLAIWEHGQDLIDTFVPGAALVERAQAASTVFLNWLEKLKKAVERKSALPADSKLQQSSLFAQYTRVLQALSGRQPLLLVLDDLQWIDAGSASLLFHLGRSISGTRILIVGAFRSDEVALGREGERHPMDSILHEFKRDFGDIEIEVGKTEGRAFVDALIDSEPNRLEEKFRSTLFRLTKGHALFTIELLRNMQESGFIQKDAEGIWAVGPELNWEALPARIDAVIDERMSRLTDWEREVLTVASVEGEEFTADVIAQRQGTEMRELVKSLSKALDKRHHLVSAKGIRQLQARRLSLYLFQHILFQRYLYNGLDEIERSLLHGEVGNILEALYGEQADEISLKLARHFHEAGETANAIKYFHKSGERAVRVSADQEAIQHFRQALKLLETQPESIERDKQELTLQLAMTVPLMAAQGFASPELGRAATRARDLCQKFGDPPDVFMALTQIGLYYSCLPEYRKALEIADQTSKLAEMLDDPMLKAIAYYNGGWPWLNLGELTRALELMEKLSGAYDPEKHGYLAYIFGYDLGVMAQAFGSWCLWLLGYPDQAEKQVESALLQARDIGHPHTLAFALVGAIAMQWFLRNREGVDRYVDELGPISYENGFIFFIGHVLIYQGEKKTLEGEVEEGIPQMKKGVETIRATGSETCLTRLQARMGDACLQAREIEEGLKATSQGLEFRDRFEELYMEAELLRLKGELLRLKGTDEREAEELFRSAIMTAQGQKAKSLELRAVMSLSRLLKDQGKPDEAKALLEEIYGWFSEGLDRPDLQDAKALLTELS
jgi:tetratricopeptide (TPR) repeat protein